MQKKIIVLVLTVLAAIVLVGGLFAFYNYSRASHHTSYQLLTFNIAGGGFLNGVPLYITLGHGQLKQVQIFVISQHVSNSTMVLSCTINPAGSSSLTNSTYTLGETIIVHRTYQDGYAETTDSILLTKQMLVGIVPPIGASVRALGFLEIPVLQWFPLAVSG